MEFIEILDTETGEIAKSRLLTDAEVEALLSDVAD